jgi:hypothetical protein
VLLAGNMKSKSCPGAGHGSRWGVEIYFHSFLNLSVDGDQGSASLHGCFTPGKKVPHGP